MNAEALYLDLEDLKQEESGKKEREKESPTSFIKSLLGTSVSSPGNFKLPYLGKTQQPQEQRYPFLSVCGVFFVCPNNGMAANI